MPIVERGRVVEFESGLRWRVLFPGLEHEAASENLRELAASDWFGDVAQLRIHD
ncbi:hypothetical protein GCM10009789_77320 [Kribbella sancticallisti]|uniref:Uncharacterized protein n=1 Tax=Kribbella sancticallisti TaxID=460087 RepID=A0ABN2EM44_9ACTN